MWNELDSTRRIVALANWDRPSERAMQVWWCNQSRQWDVERPSGVVCSSNPTAGGGNARYRKTVGDARALRRPAPLGRSNGSPLQGLETRAQPPACARRSGAAIAVQSVVSASRTFRERVLWLHVGTVIAY